MRSWRRAGELLDDREIGDLQRIELSAPNFCDWGVHLVDLANMFADDRPAEWVLTGFDCRMENRHFGVHHENQLLAQWKYEYGIRAVATTGAGSDLVSATMGGTD